MKELPENHKNEALSEVQMMFEKQYSSPDDCKNRSAHKFYPFGMEKKYMPLRIENMTDKTQKKYKKFSICPFDWGILATDIFFYKSWWFINQTTWDSPIPMSDFDYIELIKLKDNHLYKIID